MSPALFVPGGMLHGSLTSVLLLERGQLSRGMNLRSICELAEPSSLQALARGESGHDLARDDGSALLICSMESVVRRRAILRTDRPWTMTA